MKRTSALLACLILVFAMTAVAQEAPEAARPIGGKGGDSPTGSSDCAGGIVHDDNSFENGYSGNAAVVNDFGVADLFPEILAGETVGTICVCLTSNAGIVNANVEFVVWDDDGPAGAPGTVMASEVLAVAGVPGFPGSAWYSVDFAAPAVSDGSNFLGVRYVPLAGNNLFTCADESAGTPLQTGFIEFQPAAPWAPTGASFPTYRSMLIRAEAGAGVPAVPAWGLILLGVALLVVSLVAIRRFA